MKPPVIGISIGSPETPNIEGVFNALANEVPLENCRIILIGPLNSLDIVKQKCGLDLQFAVTRSFEDKIAKSNQITVFDTSKKTRIVSHRNIASKIAGDDAIDSLNIGLKLAYQFKIDALVIGSLSFETLAQAGFHYASIEQILSEWTRAEVVEITYHHVVVFSGLPCIVIGLTCDNKDMKTISKAITKAIELAIERVNERKKN